MESRYAVLVVDLISNYFELVLLITLVINKDNFIFNIKFICNFLNLKLSPSVGSGTARILRVS